MEAISLPDINTYKMNSWARASAGREGSLYIHSSGFNLECASLPLPVANRLPLGCHPGKPTTVVVARKEMRIN